MLPNLLIFGASTRAAAFSALRSGLQPWCADLFADRDLLDRCPAMRLPGRYPHDFLKLLDVAPPGPWMYTGGLENWPRLVGQMAQRRPLWGNDASVLTKVRCPVVVNRCLQAVGLPAPATRTPCERPPREGQWLLKPLRGAGGRGILRWPGTGKRVPVSPRQHYWQELIEGPPAAALFLGDSPRTRFLGLTRQLVGLDWLHAAPFHYCGSIGPLMPVPSLVPQLESMGKALADHCGLRGLFGVDCILRDDAPWAVEVNPRFTASVEVLEYATGLSALALHRRVFDPDARQLATSPVPPGIVGKAILFAKAPLIFPDDGPWMATLHQGADAPRSPAELWQLPAFADIPPAGQRVEAGQPILTFFARADTVERCEQQLRQTAAELDALFWKNEKVAT